MSGVSLNTSYTASTRVALSDNMQEASRAAIAMSTGNAITHAYEDPTGLAIGSSMRAEYDVLSIVATGIEQSKSMLYVAEDGIKSVYNSVTQMNQILARAKLGYMTDELIKNTLAPTYVQLKNEVNRIADAITFNGQNLLNGTGGKVTIATRSTVQATPTLGFTSAEVLLPNIKLGAGITASVNGGAAGAISFNGGNEITSNVQLSGGTISASSTAVTISGATLTISGVTISDATAAPNTKTCTADVKLSNVTITITPDSMTPTDGVLSTATATKTVVTQFDASKELSISNIQGTGSAFIQTITGITGAAYTPTVVNAANKVTQVNTVDAYYPLTGGIGGKSTFEFVTGSDLNHSIIDVDFPNVKLSDASGMAGLVSTLNTNYFTDTSAPTDLTNLTSRADADTDIPLVAALADQLIIFLDNIGAYQKRFMNIQSQLTTSVEQLDLAQGAILNTDLAKETENFGRASVKVNVAIAMLNNLNESMKQLERLVV